MVANFFYCRDTSEHITRNIIKMIDGVGACVRVCRGCGRACVSGGWGMGACFWHTSSTICCRCDRFYSYLAWRCSATRDQHYKDFWLSGHIQHEAFKRLSPSSRDDVYFPCDSLYKNHICQGNHSIDKHIEYDRTPCFIFSHLCFNVEEIIEIIQRGGTAEGMREQIVGGREEN